MSKTPIITQISWMVVIPQMIIMIAVVVIATSLVPPDRSNIAVFSALGLFVAYSMLSRQLIAHEHRHGIRLIKRKRFEEAISHFEASFQFFSSHPSLDRWRSIVMLSASGPSYREMALVNIAFCHGQIGNGIKTREYYQKALDMFPDSGLAQAGMNMALAFEKKGNPEQTASGNGVSATPEP
jgi:tetratricopeptide (TPR) repeat protein